MIIVKFENGETYSIDEEQFIVKREKNASEKPDILIVKKLTNEVIEYSIINGIKLFECNKNPIECLENLTYKLFPQCKSCKFM